MYAWTRDSESWWNDCQKELAKQFRWHVKTGPIPKPHTDSCRIRVWGEEDILAGHFQSTRDRFRSTDGLVLIHDTTEFSFHREQPELIGNIKLIAGPQHRGKPQFYTTCGILMHSSLVVTTEGLPLGISAIKFWTRKEFKGNQRA